MTASVSRLTVAAGLLLGTLGAVAAIDPPPSDPAREAQLKAAKEALERARQLDDETGRIHAS